MRILVLGGNGFIGSHLVDALVAGGANVRILTKPGCQSPQKRYGVEYRYVDFVTDTVSVSEALVDTDLVVHLISTTVPATANQDPLSDINNNLTSTVKLLQLMRGQGVSRLLFLSSGGTVYGNTKSIPIAEEHVRNPVSSYGIVKVAIENYISMFTMQHDLKSLVLRVSNPYGPRQGHLGVQGVINTFFQRIISGEEIRIWGDGSNIRDYLYIDDLISFMTQAIKHNISGVYNVGSGKGTNLKDILSLIEDITCIAPKVRYHSTRGFDVKRVVLDISKARKALGWKPKVSLRDGCERYWRWVEG